MKKGTFPIEKLVAILFILIGFLAMLAFFAPKGWLNQVTEPIKDLGHWLIKDSEYKEPEPSFSKQVSDNFTALVNVFENPGNDQCLLVYPELEAINGKFSIAIEKQGDDILFRVLDDQGAEYDSKVVPNKIPCIVAGDGAKLFYDNYLDGSKNNELTDFKAVDKIVISNVYDLKADDKEDYSLEDNGLKVKDGEQEISLIYNRDIIHLCFFTTNDVINYNGYGLDDDFIWELYQKNRLLGLPLCGKENEDPHKEAISEFDRLLSFIKGTNLGTSLCKKTFRFDTNKLERDYYVVFRENGQVALYYQTTQVKEDQVSAYPMVSIGNQDDLDAFFDGYNDLSPGIFLIDPYNIYSQYPIQDISGAIKIHDALFLVNKDNKSLWSFDSDWLGLSGAVQECS